MEFLLTGPAATLALGRSISAVVKPGSNVLLEGPLGSGKTTLVKGIFQGLGGVPDEVLSPSFTLINVYRGGRLPLYHVDLYRLAPRQAGEDPDIAEALSRQDGVKAIEWAGKLRPPPSEAVRVVLDFAIPCGPRADRKHTESGEGRTASVSGVPEDFVFDEAAT